MKIQEFASGRNLSNNAIYKAIRREGYSAKELTDKRGNITPAGFKILRLIYPEKAEEQQTDPEQRKEAEPGRELLERELDSIRGQLTEARERAEKWEKLYLDLQDKAAQERTEMQQQIKASQVLLAQQQEINSRLLMNPIKRLFSGKKKELDRN